MLRSWIFRFLGAMVLVVITGCTHVQQRNGWVPDDTPLFVKQHSQADVRRLWGSPTYQSLHDSRTWYYISQITRISSLQTRQSLMCKIHGLQFDSQGVLCKQFVLEAPWTSVTLEEQATPDPAESMGSMFQQIFKNFGRISA